MPFIHIKSLPFEEPKNIAFIIKGITEDFSENTGIPLFHIHTTWEFFLPGHYTKGDKNPAYQPEGNHPLIIDLLTPDFNDSGMIASMLVSIAESVSNRAEFPKNNIFINHRQAYSGMVYDDGKIVSW